MPRNFDSSFLTQKRQAEEIFANYTITNQKINQGCTTRGFFQQGAAGTFSSQQITEVNEGANLIGARLRDAVINAPQNVCPVNINVPSGPGFVLPTSGADVLAFTRTLSSTFPNSSVSPTSGGTLTINDANVGNFDYTISGTTTISSFSASNWFTSTEDSAWAVIIVNGDLTINAGQTFIPSVRKLCTVLYVSGNLVCDGTISMTARGANHSGTGNSGGATAATDLRIGTGTFGAITNPQIPAAGGAGGAGSSVDNTIVNGSSVLSGGGSGGGGAGGKFGGTGRGGNGAAGTSFSGGGGGGGMFLSASNGGDAVANGGKGGDGLTTSTTGSAGGTGNPGGTGTGLPNGPNGNVGTGGALIVIVEGNLSGNGSILSNGVSGAIVSGQVGGGGSGGGSVTILFKTDSSTISPVASGGTGNTNAGAGGAGTARKLAIGSN